MCLAKSVRVKYAKARSVLKGALGLATDSHHLRTGNNYIEGRTAVSVADLTHESKSGGKCFPRCATRATTKYRAGFRYVRSTNDNLYLGEQEAMIGELKLQGTRNYVRGHGIVREQIKAW